ncbi:hypothetical protein HW932_21295 [Allochromatium humboldtianum]|uniref:Uncharacterized protein n=1 Tax=Allochromatium humboldtianum TaxID=504901 RepID=A0A850RL02_9GAMM|nr:hypothetical protein [Allochromatium humboldtianum]NVZ11782.1 hypothetical protein [Allochromatium humboldtianum]
MHESIASALYKGYTRKLIQDGFQGELLPANTRAAWLRQVVKMQAKDRSSVAMAPPAFVGRGKNAELYIHGVYYPSTEIADGEKITPQWYGYAIRARAKDFTIESQPLPVIITNHLVQRTMQRLDVAHPRQALLSLQSAFLASLLLEPPSKGHALLPARGGAVIAVPDRDYPMCWAMLTFVNKERLSVQQMREVLDVGNQIVKHTSNFFRADVARKLACAA